MLEYCCCVGCKFKKKKLKTNKVVKFSFLCKNTKDAGKLGCKATLRQKRPRFCADWRYCFSFTSSLNQCFGSGSGSALDPYSAASGIRIQWYSFDFFRFGSQTPKCSYTSLQKGFLKITYGLAARYCCCELSEKTAVKIFFGLIRI